MTQCRFGSTGGASTILPVTLTLAAVSLISSSRFSIKSSPSPAVLEYSRETGGFCGGGGAGRFVSLTAGC